MQGKANFRGHPLHLMLISFPIAFWTGAFFTDVVGSVRGDEFWFRMSVVLIAMGTAVAVPASICGFIDYRTVPLAPRARSIATRHLAWSLGATAVFAAADLVRIETARAPAGLLLTAVGGVLLLVGGWLGSDLANRFHVGVRESPPTDVTRAPL